MAYVKNTWETGDVITAEKLNHVENGIADLDDNSIKVYRIMVTITSSDQYGILSGTCHTDFQNVTSWETLWSSIDSLFGQNQVSLINIQINDTVNNKFTQYSGFPYYTGEGEIIYVGAPNYSGDCMQIGGDGDGGYCKDIKFHYNAINGDKLTFN